MSQSALPSATIRTSGPSSNDVQTIVAENTIQELFGALDDTDCQGILAATSEEALTATEVSETCDLPLSTTYRKLDLLTEASLLEERPRIRQSGKHPSEYTRLVDDIVISLGLGGETVVRVSQRKSAERTGSLVSMIGD